MDVWNNFLTLKSLETRPIDGLSLGVAKGEFKSSHMIDTPPVCRASNFAVVKILLHTSQLTILGVRKPTGQLKHNFTVADTRANQ